MRPPEFTGGNMINAGAAEHAVTLASMRPPEFTGGNYERLRKYFRPVLVLQ